MYMYSSHTIHARKIEPYFGLTNSIKALNLKLNLKLCYM